MRARDSGGTYSDRPPYRIIGSCGKCTSRPLCASLHRALPCRTMDGQDIADDALLFFSPCYRPTLPSQRTSPAITRERCNFFSPLALQHAPS